MNRRQAVAVAFLAGLMSSCGADSTPSVEPKPSTSLRLADGEPLLGATVGTGPGPIEDRFSAKVPRKGETLLIRVACESAEFVQVTIGDYGDNETTLSSPCRSIPDLQDRVLPPIVVDKSDVKKAIDGGTIPVLVEVFGEQKTDLEISKLQEQGPVDDDTDYFTTAGPGARWEIAFSSGPAA